MADIITCPQCQRQLRVPDELIGRAVKCPSCYQQFTAVAATPEPLVPPRDERPDLSAARPVDEVDVVEEHGQVRRPVYRDAAPHRGALILTLGVLSLVCCGGFLLGPIAWIMGNTDMREIRAGRMDPDGEGLTNAGRICGMVGAAKGLLELCSCGLFFLAALADLPAEF